MLRVRFFASLRERLGRDDLAVAAPPGGITVTALVAHLETLGLAQCSALLLADNTVVAVNREVCDRGHVLADGDEVAFFPAGDRRMSRAEVEVRHEDFSVGAEYDALLAAAPGSGACVVFTGRVRADGALGVLEALELEHYPGMTEASIAAVIDEARTRWPIGAIRVIHRIGRLAVGEQIVLVGVCSAHRDAAFAAAGFVMDYLKTRAPIWKKEIAGGSGRWVEQRAADREAAARWQRDADEERA